MKKIVLIVLLLMFSVTVFAQSGDKEEEDFNWVFDGGIDLTFYVLNEETQAELEASMGGLGMLTQLLIILNTLRAGPIVDFSYILSDNLLAGVETGLLYVSIENENTTSLYFNLPVYAILRLQAGPLFAQPYAGGVMMVSMPAYGESNVVFAFDTGAKVGLDFGDFTFYLNGGVIFSSLDGLYGNDFLLKFGIGGIVELTRF